MECGGIGYVLNISLRSYEELEGKSDIRIYTHQYLVRDELPVLYGFTAKSERELFRMLIAVSGVGGNTARMVLSTYTPAELRQIISGGNVPMLKKVKGLGSKTAEKIIVELRDKMAGLDVADSDTVSSPVVSSPVQEIVDEALKALVMLGFSRTASEKAVKKIVSDTPDAKVEDVIRLALKML